MAIHFQISHLLGGQAFRGHLQLRVGITDRLDQKALAHAPGMIAAPLSPPSCQPPFQSQSQPAPPLILAVALVTFTHQHGPDFSKLQPRRIGAKWWLPSEKCHKTLHSKKSNPAKKCEAVLAEIRWIGNSRIALLQLSRAQVAELDRAALAVVLDTEPTFGDCSCSTSAISLPLRKVRCAVPGFHAEMVQASGLNRFLVAFL